MTEPFPHQQRRHHNVHKDTMQNFLITARTIAKEFLSPISPNPRVGTLERADRKIDLRRTKNKKKKLLVEESTQETKTEKETSRSRVEADETANRPSKKNPAYASSPSEEQQKQQRHHHKNVRRYCAENTNKTALRQQKLLFSKNLQPKKTEKNFTKITKDLY